MNSLKTQDNLSSVLSHFWEEIFPKVDAYAIPIILERIQEWAGDQPDITKALCDYVVRYAPQLREGEVEDVVDVIVKKEIVKDWYNSLAADHLHKVEAVLLDYDRRDSLLISYIQLFQQGRVPLNNSPEQSVLLRSGVAEAERGRLKIANPLYAEIFNLDWAERQLPGITKPVSIVSSATTNSQPSSTSRLYSKIAIVLCALAILGSAVSSYVKESGGKALATTDTVDVLAANVLADPEAAAVNVKAIGSVSLDSAAVGASIEKGEGGDAIAPDRVRFDNGTEHAKSSRWVPMMREFCSLPSDSVYFAPAEKRLEQWVKLYKEDIQIAHDIVVQEQGSSCAIAADLLKPATN